MTIMSGIAASRVRRPTMISAPQTVSTIPTKGPIRSGKGIPILAKRPAPSTSGKMSFCIPSGKNTTRPTEQPDEYRPTRSIRSHHVSPGHELGLLT